MLYSSQYIELRVVLRVQRTRVVVRTVERRGKSLIPWSSIEIELSRSCRDDFKDWTEAESEVALEDDIIATRLGLNGRKLEKVAKGD